MQFNQTKLTNSNSNQTNSNTPNGLNKSDKCHSILQKHFKHKSFRENQLQIILNTINGGDSLVVMATGSGKSLCYQIPPIYSNKAAIVVSPLLSLIQNQVQSLRSKGIAAIAFTTGSKVTQLDYEEAFQNNTYSVIYITPEGVSSKLHYINNLYLKHGISCIAIDESHCVSEWGFDFRPAYKQLYKLRDSLPNIPILALTATATKIVQNDMVKLLKLGQSNHILSRFISTFNRVNLSYFLHEKKTIMQDLCSVIARKHYYSQGSTIIYTSSRDAATKIAAKLGAKGVAAGAYHGGINNNTRNDIQAKWERNQLQCIVATIAFGMGIDKPDIRYVIHYGMPDSIEAYYQHTGRAGRDGNKSQCILFWSRGDFSKSDWRANQSNSQQNQNRIIAQTQKMKQFTYSRECRITFILRHFGEEFKECVDRCDNCIQNEKEKNNISHQHNNNNAEKDYTNEAKNLVRACSETGQRFGITTLIHMVHGKENKSTNRVFNIKNKPSWNSLNKYSNAWITALSRKVIELGFLGEKWMNGNGSQYRRGYKRIYVTDEGNKLLRGYCSVPPWIPDSDMVKAEKETRSKVSASSRWAFNRSKVANITPQSLEKFAFKSNNNGGNSNRKRSYSEVSISENTKDIFNKRAVSAQKRRKVSDIGTVVVAAESVNSLMDLSLCNGNNTNQQKKPELLQNPTGDGMKEKLLTIRKRLAQKNGLIAYQVVSNDGIDILQRFRPSSVENLKLLDIKEAFISKYGRIVTGWIKKYCDKHALVTDLHLNITDNTDNGMEIEEENKEDTNKAIIFVPQQNDSTFFEEPTLPSITRQSQQIYESFCCGQSINNIVRTRVIKRETVEKCLSDMIINGYKIDWNKFAFTITEIRECFVVLSQVGIQANYDTIRERNAAVLAKLTDSQIDLLIARYIIDNFKKPKARNFGKKWTVNDDEKLWQQRHECVISIAKAFGRKESAVMGRLAHLRDTHNKNHERLADVIGEFGRHKIKCFGEHLVSDGLAEYELEDKEWSVAEDLCLFENRDCCVTPLRQHFGVRFGVITRRLMDLSGVDFGARARMMKYGENKCVDNVDEKNRIDVGQRVEVNSMVVQKVVSNAANGIGADELVKHLNIDCDGKAKLFQILQDMSESFQIYLKDDKYFSF